MPAYTCLLTTIINHPLWLCHQTNVLPSQLLSAITYTEYTIYRFVLTSSEKKNKKASELVFSRSGSDKTRSVARHACSRGRRCCSSDAYNKSNVHANSVKQNLNYTRSSWPITQWGSESNQHSPTRKKQSWKFAWLDLPKLIILNHLHTQAFEKSRTWTVRGWGFMW